MNIYVWEYAVSPHLGNILSGMAERGFKTVYVVKERDYAERRGEGWLSVHLPGVEIVHSRNVEVTRDIISRSSPDDLHICIGLRANNHVKTAAEQLRAAGRRFLVFMETVNERKWWSSLKRPLYYWLFARNRPWLEGILAAGSTTSEWVVGRGMPESLVFDFAYFLSEEQPTFMPINRNEADFRLLYAGNLIPRKRVHLIIGALKELPPHVLLDIVGDGPLREQIQAQAKLDAPGRVTFHGARPMSEVAGFMASADCLVLPSDHDGWGAVISEALLAGTRVVCSDSCGASVAVRASGAGQVFETFSETACTEALRKEVARGPADIASRSQIALWAQCLNYSAGAAYLEAIINHLRSGARRPVPPWLASSARPVTAK